jgi:hypothetical protein
LIFAVTSLGNALPQFCGFHQRGASLAAWPSVWRPALSPMYIAEIAPAQMRGKLVAINQLTVVIGILLAQYINWFLVRDLPGRDGRLHPQFLVRPAGLALDVRPDLRAGAAVLYRDVVRARKPALAGEKWQGKISPATSWKKSAAKLCDAATAEIQSTLATEEIQRVRFADLLEPKMRKVIVLGVVLAVFQQWCGINVIFNYAEEIFRAAGYDISSACSKTSPGPVR